MIESLTLINFQIHEKVKIEFDEKFNVILGHNNKGKSSIIRGIFWVFYNEPNGDWMRRIDENGNMTETLVKIKFSNGDIIKRIKGTGINKYVVNGDEFENFGYGVPQKVKEILRIQQFKTNKAEFPLNIFMQDDQPFLIHETGPIKASVIDVLTGVSLLQRSITEFNKDKLENVRLSKILQDQVTEDKDQLSRMPDVKKLKELMEQSKDIENKRYELEFSVNNLRILKDKYEYGNERLKELETKKVDIDSLIKLKEKLDKAEIELNKLRDLKRRYERYKVDVDLKELEIKENEILNEEVIIEQCGKEINGLLSRRNRYLESVTTINHVNGTIPLLEKELKRIWKVIKVCPLCGRKPKND